MPESQWYLAENGAALGPFALGHLRSRAAAGHLRPSDLLSPNGQSGWVPARIVPGLFPPAPPADGHQPPLVPCAKCRAGVSDAAMACPHCGHPQPAAEAAAGGKRGAECGVCGVLNVVSDGYGRFSTGQCRGCGRSLRETNPAEFLDAEMERVYANSVERPPTAAVPWAFVISFGLHCAGVLPRTPEGKTYPLALFAAMGLLYLGFRRAMSRWIRWNGSLYEVLGTRSEVAGDMRNRSWEPVAARYTRRGAGTASPGEHPTARSPLPTWIKMAVAAATVACGYSVYQAEFSQYALGQKAGVRHVREMSAKGPFIRAGMNVGNILDLIPTNPNASPDWNAGFRAGFQEELQRMYPDLNRR